MCLLLVWAGTVTVLAQAKVEFTLSADDQTLRPGDTVTLSASCSSTEKATSYGLMLSYDTAVFQVVEGECNAENALVTSFKNGFAFMFEQSVAYSGQVGTVTLKVLDSAAEGSHTVTGKTSVKNGAQTVESADTSVTVTVSAGAEQPVQTQPAETQPTATQPTATQPTATQPEPAGQTQPVSACASGHSFGQQWLSDESGHWRSCTVCGATEETENHIPGKPAQQYTPQSCEVCGYVLAPATNAKDTKDAKGSFPVWIVAVAAVAAVGVAAVAVTVKRKRSQ